MARDAASKKTTAPGAAGAATRSESKKLDQKDSVKALFKRMKWPEAAVDALVDEQGIDDLSTLRYLTEELGTALCRTLRKPGGGEDGVSLSVLAEETLKMILFFIKHRDRVSRTTKLDKVQLSDVRGLAPQRKLELATMNDKVAEPPSINLRCMPKTMENIKEWCSKIRGVSGAPLAYMMRANLMPKNEADEIEEEFDSVDNEMIHRAPILDLDYEYDTDNETDADLKDTGPFSTSF